MSPGAPEYKKKTGAEAYSPHAKKTGTGTQLP